MTAKIDDRESRAVLMTECAVAAYRVEHELREAVDRAQVSGYETMLLKPCRPSSWSMLDLSIDISPTAEALAYRADRWLEDGYFEKAWLDYRQSMAIRRNPNALEGMIECLNRMRQERAEVRTALESELALFRAAGSGDIDGVENGFASRPSGWESAMMAGMDLYRWDEDRDGNLWRRFEVIECAEDRARLLVDMLMAAAESGMPWAVRDRLLPILWSCAPLIDIDAFPYHAFSFAFIRREPGGFLATSLKDVWIRSSVGTAMRRESVNAVLEKWRNREWSKPEESIALAVIAGALRQACPADVSAAVAQDGDPYLLSLIGASSCAYR